MIITSKWHEIVTGLNSDISVICLGECSPQLALGTVHVTSFDVGGVGGGKNKLPPPFSSPTTPNWMSYGR